MPRKNRNHASRRDPRWGSPRKRPRFDEDERDARAGERERARRQDRERDQERRDRRHASPAAGAPPFEPASLVAEPVARACGSCREWVADESGGRGTCTHPGSGFLMPWADTPACDFFDPVRGLRRVG